MNDNDHIKTQYRKSGFATASHIVLSESATTRTVFRPGLSSVGVRGHVIRQKIGGDGAWKDVNEADFRTLPPDIGVSIELDSAATRQLFDKLGNLYQIQAQGVSYGHQDYVVAKSDEVIRIDDKSKAQVIRQLIKQG